MEKKASGLTYHTALPAFQWTVAMHTHFGCITYLSNIGMDGSYVYNNPYLF